VYYIHLSSHGLANNQQQELYKLLVLTPVTIGAPPIPSERRTYQNNSHAKLQNQPHINTLIIAHIMEQLTEFCT